MLEFIPITFAALFSGRGLAPSPGQAVSAVFPPKVTETFNASAIFPDETAAGFNGPTPTGDEAAAIQTALSFAPLDNAYPLINPPTRDHKKTNVLRKLGNLSPHYSVSSALYGLPHASPQVPHGCQLDSVHMWNRHGARYPTSGPGPATFAAKLRNATNFRANGELEFLNTWTYKLASEILSPFGRSQLYNLGVSWRIQYGKLLEKFSALPVFRSTTQDRMAKSAINFAGGFFGIPDYTTNFHQLLIIESSGSNNTLAPYETCANSNRPISSAGVNATMGWISKYLQPAHERIQSQLEGVNLTVIDIFYMQQMCAYETVSLGYSAFCDLFTDDEWEGFDYALDLGFYYSNSWGSPTSVAMGIGAVQELVARLTHTPIQSHNSSTNATLDDSEITFPLHQPLYVDMSHDTVISTIIVALNLTATGDAYGLPLDRLVKNRIFKSSQQIPFAATLVGQVLSCPASSEPTHIRWLVNDAVVPLTNIPGCTFSPDGLCELNSFIGAMKQRIREVDWSFDCLANYTVPDPYGIRDGRPPAASAQHA